jgi:5-methylcytosine-specific restriction endonuclease McrA
MSSQFAHSLDASVLVLNRLFMAIHVISARRAFCLLFKELAEVVNVEDGQFASYNFDSWREVSEFRARFKGPDDDWIRTVHFEMQVPRIIRLLGYEKLPRQTVKFNRRQYCGRKFATTDLSLDHIVPRTQGGQSTWTNVVCACLKCNVRKGGRTPREAGMTLTRPAEKPRRSPLLNLKLTNAKYRSWKAFLDNAYWSVELK